MSAITPEKFSINAKNVLTAGTLSGTSSTDHTVARSDAARLLLYIASAGTAGTISVYAGVNPPAFRAEMGSLAVGIPVGTVAFIPIESARFVGSAGTITLNQTFLADATLAVIELPDDL